MSIVRQVDEKAVIKLVGGDKKEKAKKDTNTYKRYGYKVIYLHPEEIEILDKKKIDIHALIRMMGGVKEITIKY